MNSFNGLNWQNMLATLNGSAGGTWLNLTGITDENGVPITGVTYIQFVVPATPPLDPNTGNPEILMLDAVVGTSGPASSSASEVTLSVANVQNAIPGLNVPTTATGSLNITGTPTASGTMTFTVTATDAVGATTTATYSITVPPTVSIRGSASVNEGTIYTLNLDGTDGAHQHDRPLDHHLGRRQRTANRDRQSVVRDARLHDRGGRQHDRARPRPMTSAPTARPDRRRRSHEYRQSDAVDQRHGSVGEGKVYTLAVSGQPGRRACDQQLDDHLGRRFHAAGRHRQSEVGDPHLRDWAE